MKATISFFLNIKKKKNSNGKIPLYARVLINRTKAECSLSAEIAEDVLVKWDPVTMRFIDRSNPGNMELNDLDQKPEVRLYEVSQMFKRI